MATATVFAPETIVLTQGKNPEDTYLLARDEQERQRLNEQHQILYKNIGYIIHPRILERLPKTSRVADVAAGSGAWTLSAADLLSQGSHIDGYDISAAQFPSRYPPNVNFSEHNAKRSFPKELHGTYDVVHVRALVAAMDPDDWKLVVKNLLQLLKPGGALQWCEGDLSRLRALRGELTLPAKPFNAIPRLLDAFHGIASKRTGYGIEELPSIFQEGGLQDVEVDTISSDRDISTRTPLTQTYVVAMFGWARNALPEISTEAMELWKTEVDLEVQGGAYIRGDSITVIGFKQA